MDQRASHHGWPMVRQGAVVMTHMTHHDAYYSQEVGCNVVDRTERYRQRGKSQGNASCASCASLPADDLDRLAHAVSRLSPSHRDPHRFHEDKSEIVAELRRVARALGSPTPVRVR